MEPTIDASPAVRLRSSTWLAVASRLVPGLRVRHPGEPGWGIGQVQSVIGDRITVNFEHAGKRLINGAVIQLEAVESDTDGTE